LLITAPGLAIQAHAIENTASGTVNASNLDTTNATIVLNLVGGTIDTGNSTVTVNPAVVPADGVTVSTITVVLLDADNLPVPGKTVAIATDRGALDIITQPIAPTDAAGTAVGTIRSGTAGSSTITVTDVTDSIILPDQPQVYFTQGQVIDLVKTASKKRAVPGDVVTYLVETRNLSGNDVGQVKVDDQIPPNFRYVTGSTRLNGSAVPDPAGNRPLTFDLGTIPALVDINGNGVADPGEPGYMALSYQLVIGSGARPDEYINTAIAWDASPSLLISNSDEAMVTVIMDPLFDLGTIIGKVFEDRNRSGWQDDGEKGIQGAMVFLDDGTYVITDEYGRYHFPAVRPGHRLVKIDRQSLPNGGVVFGDESRIVSVTPGLLVKVNFTAIRETEPETIGRPAGMGLRMSSRDRKEPLNVLGSVEMMTVLVNGTNADLSTNDVVLKVRTLDEFVTITGGRLEGQIHFQAEIDSAEKVDKWILTIKDSGNETIRTFSGEGAPPDLIGWNGITDKGDLIGGGEVYRYRMEIWYVDGGHSSSASRIFGVNQRSVVSLNISGMGFEFGSAVLHPKTKEILSKVAETFRKFPDEVVVIEGHADSIGSDEANLRLSRERAQSAFQYLVVNENLAENRFVVKGYGESRPIASNEIPEGREINRRVEIKGQVLEVEKAELLDRVRNEPEVMVNGTQVDVEADGRFQTQVPDEGQNRLEIRMVNTAGRSLEGSIPIPALQILEPQGVIRLSYGEVGDRYRVGNPGPDGKWESGDPALNYRLSGKTDPGNIVELEEKLVPVDEKGVFDADLVLKIQEVNSFSLLVKNPAGFTRIANIKIQVTEKDEDGRLIVMRDPIPHLSVQLPPEGTPLFNAHLKVPGVTEPGNNVWINGRKVEVYPDGEFTGNLELEKGNNLLRIRTVDPDGNTGTIERNVVLSERSLFLMAFADGKIGQLQGKGYLDGAGMEKDKEFYQEGRVAYYIKGTIAGKYLITSAFDSGTGKFGEMFQDLDEGERDQFFTNLDPDKHYPVYGDASTATYDAQSQGKFYLALTSEEFNLLVGNYSLNLSDTELAAYQRTFYGGKFTYQSLSRTKYGEPDTTVLLFGAQVRYTHVRDELRATGGSLYYLSRRDISEGSDEVAIIIRDQNTGLIRARILQKRDIDYQIKYEEGRILMKKPLASVIQDDLLIDDALLSGSPVSLQVDYEVRADALEKSSAGGRVQKRVADNLAIGGTYIDDQLESGNYELSGLDVRLRLGQNSWISGEYARSAGSDSPVFISEDGGLTYTEIPAASSFEGNAWRAAAQFEVGHLFGSPDSLKVGGYVKRLEPGFQSNANFTDEGIQKTGVDFTLNATSSDTISGRYDQQEKLETASLPPGVESESRTGTLQWAHKRARTGITLEYRTKETEDVAGDTLINSSLGAARLDLTSSNRLSGYLEHQASMTGPDNDQTSIGMEYLANKALSFRAAGTHGTKGNSVQGEANLNLGESRMYLTEHVAEDNAGHNSTTILGTETSTSANSKIYTENQWEHTGDGTDRQISLLGVQRNWDLAPGLTALFSGEASEIESEPETLRRYTIATGLSYKLPERLEARLRGEVRRERGSQERVQYLTANQLDVSLAPDYSLLGRYNYSVTRDLDLDEIEARFEERSIGLAYRPVEHDRFNLLARYTQLRDQAPKTLDEMESQVTYTQVGSVEWSFDLTPRLEWVEKNALKTKEEKTGDRPPIKTNTSLSLHRLNYNFLGDFDLGLEYRMKLVDKADDQQVGWLTELMYTMGGHFRLGLGFNFTDFSDNEFSENDYSVRGVFLRFQAKY
jgi:uncharacterized repeat protein (TIGR01451 family)